jgi:Acetyl-CoA hydrolase/transferase C-terminal domain
MRVLGSSMMNGVGGSGDFIRNAVRTVFIPMLSHVDHNEHSVQIMVSQQDLADLRPKSPKERARLIIDKCVHPMYKYRLKDYSHSHNTPRMISNRCCPGTFDRKRPDRGIPIVNRHTNRTVMIRRRQRIKFTKPRRRDDLLGFISLCVDVSQYSRISTVINRHRPARWKTI